MNLDDVLKNLGSNSSSSNSSNPNYQSGYGDHLITNDPNLTNAEGNTTRITSKQEPAKVQANAPATDLSTNIFAGLNTQMEAIQREQDPLKRETALSNLKGSIAETSATLTRETRLIAEREAGLPQLEAALKRAEQLDRADPLWNQHLTDSKETASIRNMYYKGQEKAGQLSKRMLAENPTIAGMAARLDGFVRTQESLISKDLSRSEKRDDLINQEMLSLGTDTPKYLTYIMPEIGNDPRKAAEVKLSVRTDVNKKDLAPFFSPNFSEDDILPLSFMGNRPAQQMAIRVQAEKTGQSIENVKKNLSNANAFVNNEGFFLEQMKAAAGVDPAFREAMNAYTKLNLQTGKEAQKQKFLARMDLVESWTAKQATLKAVNDVESWNGDINLRSSPGIAASLDKLKTLKPGSPISMENLIGDYVSTAPDKDKAVRMDEIKAVMTSAVEKSNKGLYGKIDLISMNQRLKASTAFSTLQLGSMMDTFGDTMATYINNNPGMSGLGAR